MRAKRVNAANRTVLALLGIVLLAAGVVGLIIGFGIRTLVGLRLPEPGQPIAADQLLTAANDSPWFWWVVAAASLLVALLALRWLIAQLATDRVRHLDLTENDRDGTTTLSATAVADGAADDAKLVPGVDNASAHLRVRPPQQLVLTVDVALYADLSAVRAQLEETAISNTRHVLDNPDLPVHIELRPTDTRRALV